MNIFFTITHASGGVIAQSPSIADILLSALSFLLSFVGIVAILAVVLSGLQYILAFGDTGKISEAKNSFKYSIFGTVIALGSLILLKTIEGLLR